jgi:hypothetical protein
LIEFPVPTSKFGLNNSVTAWFRLSGAIPSAERGCSRRNVASQPTGRVMGTHGMANVAAAGFQPSRAPTSPSHPPGWPSVARFLWRVFKMGGTDDPPVPVGDPPTGMARRVGLLKRAGARKMRLSVPSGESPDGTGQWPVPPKTISKTRPNPDISQ